MATATADAGIHGWCGVDVLIEYDSVTLVVAAVQVTNPQGKSVSVTVTSPVGATTTIAAAATAPGVYTRYAVPGGIVLTSTKKLPAGWGFSSTVS